MEVTAAALSTSPPLPIGYAAFPRDVEHEVMPVVSGHTNFTLMMTMGPPTPAGDLTFLRNPSLPRRRWKHWHGGVWKGWLGLSKVFQPCSVDRLLFRVCSKFHLGEQCDIP